MVTIKVLIYLEKTYWVGLFERVDKAGYSAAKHVFGKDPSNPEIYEFVLKHYHELNFGEFKNFELKIKRKNPKRIQREVRREMEKIKETTRPSTYSLDYIKEQQQKYKAERKILTSSEKRERKEKQFILKQVKKKEKKKGR